MNFFLIGCFMQTESSSQSCVAEMIILGITTALTSHRAKIIKKKQQKKKTLPEAEHLEQTEA